MNCYDQVSVDRDELIEDGVDLSESPFGSTEFYSDVWTAGKLRVEDDVRMFGICPVSICIEEFQCGRLVQSRLGRLDKNVMEIYQSWFSFLPTGWTVRGSNLGGCEIFCTCPDRPRGPTNLLYNGYRVFPGGKVRPGRDAHPSPPSSAEVKYRVELDFYSP